MSEKAKEQILVLVHPGSACGSADFNLGHVLASRARSELVREINSWAGPVVVIEGDLCDELPEYPALEAAIRGALSRAKAAGLLSLVLSGPDPEQMERAGDLADMMEAACRKPSFLVSGAWYMPDEGGGCVGSVVEVLQGRGFDAATSEAAVRVIDEDDEDEVAEVDWAALDRG